MQSVDNEFTRRRLIGTVTRFAVFAIFLSACTRLGLSQDAAPTVAKAPAVEQATELVHGRRWIEHISNDLAPYWMSAEAIGEPAGNFPTFRCDDGSVFDPQLPCKEFANLDTPGWRWIKEGIERDYVRMKSRQIFFYCCAFHLTGEEKYLDLAKKGVTYLRTHCFDKQGIPYTFIVPSTKDTGPPQLERTCQDLAYGINGLAFYYYLTRDEQVLKDLLRVKDHIFDNYYDSRMDMIKWVAKNPPQVRSHFPDTERKELVAQLDQINAYMLLATPFLPEPHRTRWKKDMVHLCHVMIRDFYEPRLNIFWGTTHSDEGRRLESRHTDFGHTIKTLWMIERVGRLVGNKELISFAYSKAPKVWAQAYLSDEGTWASKPGLNGAPSRDKEWWIHCELDQAAATWALYDGSISRYLIKSNQFYFDKFVDHKGYEVWHLLTADDKADFPKAHLWKNGFHSSEHALVGYITSQELYDEPVTLYFAPTEFAEHPDLRPYLYSGREISRESRKFSGISGYNKVKVQFTNIR